jgi:hypothetical protein
MWSSEFKSQYHQKGIKTIIKKQDAEGQNKAQEY